MPKISKEIKIKLTPKRQSTLRRLERFMPPNYDGRDGPIALITEDPCGVSGEEAFFLRTERGLRDIKTRDVKRCNQLLVAHRHMGITVELWKKSLREGLVHGWEYLLDPDMRKLTRGWKGE